MAGDVNVWSHRTKKSIDLENFFLWQDFLGSQSMNKLNQMLPDPERIKMLYESIWMFSCVNWSLRIAQTTWNIISNVPTITKLFCFWVDSYSLFVISIIKTKFKKLTEESLCLQIKGGKVIWFSFSFFLRISHLKTKTETQMLWKIKWDNV